MPACGCAIRRTADVPRRHVRRRAPQSAWHAVGAQIGSLLPFVNKPYSETGQVKLASRVRRRTGSSSSTASDRRDLER